MAWVPVVGPPAPRAMDAPAEARLAHAIRTISLALHGIGAFAVLVGTALAVGSLGGTPPENVLYRSVVFVMATSMGPLPVARAFLRVEATERPPSVRLTRWTAVGSLAVAAPCFAFFTFSVAVALFRPVAGDASLALTIALSTVGLGAGLGLLPGALLLLEWRDVLLLEWRDDLRGRPSLAGEAVLLVLLFLGQLGSAATLVLSTMGD